MAISLVGFVCFGAVVANAALSVGDSIGVPGRGSSLVRWAGGGVFLMAAGALFLGRRGLRLAWNWLKLDADYPVISLPDPEQGASAVQSRPAPPSRDNPFLASAGAPGATPPREASDSLESR